MASAAVVAKRALGVDGQRSREDRRVSRQDGRIAPPWRAELEELDALLADSRGGCRPGDALRVLSPCGDRIAAILAEEAGDRLSEALMRRIAERAARALA